MRVLEQVTCLRKTFHEESIISLRGVDSLRRRYVAPIPGLSIWR
jgi:hypothetical protein